MKLSCVFFVRVGLDFENQTVSVDDSLQPYDSKGDFFKLIKLNLK